MSRKAAFIGFLVLQAIVSRPLGDRSPAAGAAEALPSSARRTRRSRAASSRGFLHFRSGETSIVSPRFDPMGRCSGPGF